MAAGWGFFGNLQDFLQKVTDAAAKGVYGSSSKISVDYGSSMPATNFVSTPSVQFSQDSEGNVTASAAAAAPGSTVDGGTY